MSTMIEVNRSNPTTSPPDDLGVPRTHPHSGWLDGQSVKRMCRDYAEEVLNQSPHLSKGPGTLNPEG